MTELILDEGERRKNLSPSERTIPTDVEALRNRFLPTTQPFGLDEFQNAGIQIIETVRHLGIVLGDLAEWGWNNLCPTIRWNDDPIETRTRWAEYCAMLWGCSRSTVTKAWLMATSNISVPQDLPLTTFYEILAGTDSEEEADRVVDLTIENNWRSYHIRLIKRLQDAGLLDKGEWVLPQVTRRKHKLYVAVGDDKVPFAHLKNENRLARIGTFLLTDGVGIKEDQDVIEGKSDG